MIIKGLQKVAMTSNFVKKKNYKAKAGNNLFALFIFDNCCFSSEGYSLVRTLNFVRILSF